MNKIKYYQEQTDNGLLNPAIHHIYSVLNISEQAKILDMGCGAGYLSTHRPKYPEHVNLYGVDIDVIAKNNLNLGYKKIVVKDIEAKNYKLSEFKNNFFDFIVAKDFLEHILQPWKLIPELYRVLKPGGKVWAQSPHYTSQLAWIDYTHVRPFTKHSFSMLFKDSGFIIESVKYNSLGFISNPTIVDFLVNRLPLIGHFAGNVEVIAVKPNTQ